MASDRFRQAALLVVAGLISASSAFGQYPGSTPPVALPQYDLSLTPTIKTYDGPQVQETTQPATLQPGPRAEMADVSFPTAVPESVPSMSGSASAADSPAPTAEHGTTGPNQTDAAPYSLFSDLRLWIVGGVIAIIAFSRRR